MTKDATGMVLISVTAAQDSEQKRQYESGSDSSEGGAYGLPESRLPCEPYQRQQSLPGTDQKDRTAKKPGGRLPQEQPEQDDARSS